MVRSIPACQLLRTIPGIGLLTCTALVAAVGTDVSHFHDARRLACWFGITLKEHSSGETRQLWRPATDTRERSEHTKSGVRVDRQVIPRVTHSESTSAAREQPAPS